jgi:DNA modification methylase
MNIETLRILELTPDPNNARQHDDKNLKAIMGSLKEFGQRKPIVITEAGTIVAGNGTVEAAKRLGWLDIEVVRVPSDWTDAQVKAFAIADNRTAELANWNQEVLTSQLLELEAEGWELAEFGFEPLEMPDEDKPIIEDEIPESAPGRVALGDVWQLGRHRVMCGDSTKPEDVKRLAGNEKAQLLHADPPYGMGKEGDGVANDNLYGNKLDKFQMDWWRTFRPHLEDNASAYIWGNAPELWRLWYSGGLNDFENLTFRNEILWEQEGVSWGKDGMSNLRQYANMGERCLFFMLGEQGFNNNSDNYWEGWEPLRTYLHDEMTVMGWGKKDLDRITKTQMSSHWITTSQWLFPTQANYQLIQTEAKGQAFLKEYEELKKEYEELKKEFYSQRAYFDSSHDQMSDIWRFDRVKGADRHGHATPKPIEMMARVMKSSLPKDGLCLEPFGGSGATLIGAEQTGRRCYTMELQPEYCDIIIERWEKLTGLKAELLPAKAD